jgi:hypothetical protein
MTSATLSSSASSTVTYVCDGVSSTTPSATSAPSVSPSPSPAPTGYTSAFLDSTSDSIAFPKTAAFNFGTTSSFTLALYVRGTTVRGDPVLVGDKDWQSSYSSGFALVLQSDGGVRGSVGTGSTRLNVVATAPTVLDGAWHHVAMVFTRGTPSCTLAVYVDGELAGPVDSASSGFGSITSTYGVVVGQDGPKAYATGSHVDTSVDEVKRS